MPWFVDNASQFLSELEATFTHLIGGEVDRPLHIIADLLEALGVKGGHDRLDGELGGSLGERLLLFLRERELDLAVASGHEGLGAVTEADEEPLAEVVRTRLEDETLRADRNLATTDDFHEATRLASHGNPSESGESNLLGLLADGDTSLGEVGLGGVNHGLGLTVGDFVLGDDLAVFEFGGHEEGELLPDVGHHLDDTGLGADGEDDAGEGGGIHSGHSCVDRRMPNRQRMSSKKMRDFLIVVYQRLTHTYQRSGAFLYFSRIFSSSIIPSAS